MKTVETETVQIEPTNRPHEVQMKHTTRSACLLGFGISGMGAVLSVAYGFPMAIGFLISLVFVATAVTIDVVVEQLPEFARELDEHWDRMEARQLQEIRVQRWLQEARALQDSENTHANN